MSKRTLPPAMIGIIGGGQLGRMMAISAKQMGYKIAALEPALGGPLSQVADLEINAEYDDKQALTKLLSSADVSTYEFENISSEAIQEVATADNLPQGHRPLYITQHRLKEKTAINDCGFQTAPFMSVTTEAELHEAVAKIGYPSILKTVRGGYDGKGQWQLNSDADLEKVKAVIQDQECILEGFVKFSKEMSVIVTRNASGDVEAFPAIENIHKNHILHISIAPARIGEELALKADQLARQLIKGLDFVGTLAIEMFVVGDDIVINELAPRPHNSGHVTIDACNVSQFDQHIRSVCDLPLVKPEFITPGIMVNLLGQHVEYALNMWQKPEFAGAKLHLYGKDELKRNRKVGHINFINSDSDELEKTVERFLVDFPD